MQEPTDSSGPSNRWCRHLCDISYSLVGCESHETTVSADTNWEQSDWLRRESLQSLQRSLLYDQQCTRCRYQFYLLWLVVFIIATCFSSFQRSCCKMGISPNQSCTLAPHFTLYGHVTNLFGKCMGFREIPKFPVKKSHNMTI